MKRSDYSITFISTNPFYFFNFFLYAALLKCFLYRKIPTLETLFKKCLGNAVNIYLRAKEGLVLNVSTRYYLIVYLF